MLLAGCGTPDPALATPQNNVGLVQTMAQHGLTVVSQTSGDPGCSEPGVVANAVHWRVMASTDAAPVTCTSSASWITPPSWPAPRRSTPARPSSRPAQTRAGGAVTRLDISPWRVFGDGWSADLRAGLTAALTAAAGNGGLQPPGEDQ